MERLSSLGDMSIFKHTIQDDAVRDIDTDNILKEERVERKLLFGICFWSKKANETNEFVKTEKRKLGFQNENKTV